MTRDIKTYKILSVCFRYPDEPLFEALKETDLFRSPLRGSSLEDLQAEYRRLFSLSVAGGIPPYETEYGHKDIFLKTQKLADIAGFYAAFGLEISESSHERIDFIGAELDLMFWLKMKEETAIEKGLSTEAQICREAQAKFMRDHLGRWAPFLGEQISKTSRQAFYRSVGQWLSRFVESECQRLGVEPDRISGWIPEPEVELECGPDDETQLPQQLTILK